MWCGGAVENYDLYPERRTTDDKGRKVAKSRTNVYQLEQRRCGSESARERPPTLVEIPICQHGGCQGAGRPYAPPSAA